MESHPIRRSGQLLMERTFCKRLDAGDSMEAFYQSAAHFYKEQTGIGNDDYPLRCVTGPTANASTKSVYVVAFLSRGVYS